MMLTDWQAAIPVPVYDTKPMYTEFYRKAWELAYAHIKHVTGMPQTPYMDEGFCETQIWIWDTCFMSLYCKYARDVFPGVESLNNFYEVLYGNRRLPAVLPSEREPQWTGSVCGEPYELMVHIADNPPLFAWVEYENALMKGDKEYIKELLYRKRVLQNHYEWLENLHEPQRIRGVFAPTCWIAEEDGYRWEGGRSGMDNTPRGRTTERALKQRPNNPNMLWIDAICQQALSAQMIASLYALVDDEENRQIWENAFLQKKSVINTRYWDKRDEFYYDIDVKTREFYRVKTMASFWALTAGVATDEQAKRLAEQLQNPQTFGGVVPFVSLARNDNDFCKTGEYWRGGVWLPTAYAALTGLKRYGLYQEARVAARQLLEHMLATYTAFEPHTIWETYAPLRCEPATNERGTGELVRPDFCGWSALGPIAIYIEFVLGFHTINAFTKTVEWEKPTDIDGAIGIQSLSFGDVVTDIVAEGNRCTVTANKAYTLVVNGTKYAVAPGTTVLIL